MRLRKKMFPVLGLLFAVSVTPTANADVIVRWDGTTNDVANGHQNITQVTTFSTTSGFQSPAQGANYYPNAVPPDAPDFYAAKDNTPVVSYAIWDGGNNDLLGRTQIHSSISGTGISSMFVWDFNADLQRLNLTGFGRFGAGVSNNGMRWLFQDANDNWYASDFTFTGNNVNFSSDVASIPWVTFTPHVAGVASFGNSPVLGSSLNLSGVKRVGYYQQFDSTGGGGIFSTGFSAEGVPIPEPASFALFGIGMLAATRRRKR